MRINRVSDVTVGAVVVFIGMVIGAGLALVWWWGGWSEAVAYTAGVLVGWWVVIFLRRVVRRRPEVWRPSVCPKKQWSNGSNKHG